VLALKANTLVWKLVPTETSSCVNTVRLVVGVDSKRVETRRPSGDVRSSAGVPEDRFAIATADAGVSEDRNANANASCLRPETRLQHWTHQSPQRGEPPPHGAGSNFASLGLTH